MNILYLTNYHNPYRDEFFEQLGTYCDLTVLFEERRDSNRDNSWFEGTSANSYREVFLPDGEANCLSPTMRTMVSGEWHLVVVGCYNSPRQIAAISYMRRKRIPYVVNSDGPLFKCRGFKSIMRNYVLHGAIGYLVAGEKAVPSVRREVGRRSYVASYPFSSLTNTRIRELAHICVSRDENLVIIVGQYLPCKGIDVALDAIASLSNGLRVRVIGAGGRSSEVLRAATTRGMYNVDVIPFLSPEELAKEYLQAGLLILPSRQECWGLVVNEAAACGCPIVSTWGSGAAIEFLSDSYPHFLAKPGDASSLARSIKCYLEMCSDDKVAYGQFLKNTARNYSIEKMTADHLAFFNYLVSGGGDIL